MAAPGKYTPSFSFSGYQATQPDRPLPGPRHDTEYFNIAYSLGQTIDALNDIRRDDGHLENGIVDWESLDPALGASLYPDAPSDGLIYGRLNAQWTPVIPVGIGDTLPGTARAGELFWENDSGNLFVRYQDADSAQWVQVNMTAPAAPDAGATAAIYDTRNGLEATLVPTYVAALRTNGYSAPGDGGAALYKRVETEPAHAGKVHSLDGAWWTLCPGPVNVKQFGAKGDGAADDTVAIQNAIDFAIYHGGNGTVFLPGGTYVTSDTIHLGYGVLYGGSSFYTAHLKGDYKGFRGAAGTIYNGTYIVCTKKDRPGINVQGGRHSVIENLTVVGPLEDAFDNIVETGKPVTLEATWDAAETAAGAASSRYAPLAAITVDAYAGTRPGTSYPDVAYPAFLGAVSQYDKSFTSGLTLKGVGAHGWNTGLAIQPCDADGNGDFVAWEYPYCENCKYMVSAGNSQGRNFLMTGGEARKIHRLFVNGKHGRQVGHLGATIRGLSGYGYIGGIIELTNTAASGPMLFQGLDFESIHRIGDLSSASIAPAIRFQDCRFNFRHTVTNGVPPNVMTCGVNGVVVFDEMSEFDGGQNVYSFIGNVQCLGTTIRTEEAKTKLYHKIFHNALQGGLMTDPSFVSDQSCGFTPWNITTGVTVGLHIVVDGGYRYTNRDHLLPVKACGVRRFGSYRAGADTVNAAAFYSTDNPAAFTATSIVGRTVNFTDPEVTNEQIANGRGNMPGCIIRHKETGTVMAIRSRTGMVIVAEMMNNYIDTGGGAYEPFEPFYTGTLAAPTFTGTWEFINANVYTPPYKLAGTITAASPDITNLKTNNAAAYNGGLAANDWLAVEMLWVASFSGVNGRISSVDTGTPKIVMAGNAATASTELVLDYWIREAPANEAAR